MNRAPKTTRTRKSSRRAAAAQPVSRRRILSGSIAAVTAFASLFAGQQSRAATLFWDGGTTNIAGNGDGVSAGGLGNWSTAISNWDQGAGLAHVAWPGVGNIANFGGTAGTVTLATAISADGLQLTVGGYTIATSTFPLTIGTSGIVDSNTSGTNTISGVGGLVLGGAQTWSQANGGTLVVSTGITGAQPLVLQNNGATANGITLSGSVNNGGTLTNSGTGAGATLISGIIGTNVTGVVQNSATSQLTLSGANTFTSGLTITAGTVSGITSANAFGANTSVITLGDSAANSNAVTLKGAGFTFANPIVLANIANATGTITIGASTTTAAVFTGGVTGTNNLTLNSTGGAFPLTFTTSAINNTGTVNLTGTGTGAVTISGGVGSNVTAITQNSTNALTIGTTNLTVNTSGTTITDSNGTAVTVSSGVGGTGALILNANSTGTITLSGAVNNAGAITSSGTGAGTVTIATVGGSVTNIVDSGASPLTITAAVAPTATLNTFANSGAGLFTLTGGVAGGSQNITFQANSTGGITSGAIASTGTVTNSGTGAGTTTISGAIAASVTGVTENSATSPLVLGGTNLYTGTTTITAGTLSIGADANLGAAATGVSLNGATAVLKTTGGITDTHIITVGASGGTILINAGQYYLHTANLLIGSGPLVVQGPGAIAFGTNVGNLRVDTAQSFSGPLTLNNGGSIEYSIAGALGNGVITIGNQGDLIANAGITIPNNIIVSGGTNSILSFDNLTAGAFTGAITLNANVIVEMADFYQAATNLAQVGTITGVVSGSGSMLVTANGATVTNTLTLNPATPNLFTGGLNIQGAGVALATAGAAGLGPIVLSGGPLSTLTESAANAITGVASLSVQSGTATLTTANNFTGGVAVSGGILAVNAAGAIGNNTLTQTGGAVTQSVANAFQGTTTLNLSGGTTALSLSNAYTGGANISGTNVTTVTAAGGLNGLTTVTGGTLISGVTAAGTFANGGTYNSPSGVQNSAVLVSGGVLSSAPAGGNFQNVTLSGTGAINPGGVGTVGTGPLSITNLTTGTGTTLQFDTTAPGNTDLLSVNTGSGFGANTNIALNYFSQPATAAGTYKLIQYAGSAPTLSNFVLPAAPAGESYALNTTSDPGFVDLVISGAYSAITANWNQTSAGPNSWNTPANWSGGVVPHLTGDTATFATANAAAQTITVDGQQHVGTLTLNPTAFPYTINQGTAGSTIYLDNGASAATLANSALNNTINAPIVLLSSSNVSAATATTLTLGGVISGSGPLAIAGPGSTVFGFASNTGITTTNALNVATVTSAVGLAVGQTVVGANIPTGTTITNITGNSITLSNNASATATAVAGFFANPNTFTGGVTVNSGTLGVYAPAQLSTGVTTLNGGTLSFLAGVGQVSTLAGQSLNIGPSGGTLNLTGATTAGKLFVNSPNYFTGSGTLTKTGGGDLQDNNASIGFTGNVVLSSSGLVEDQNVAALGFGTTAGFTGGSITINGPVGAGAPELVTGGVQIFNPITLAGGTLSANGNNNGIFNSTVTVNAASTLRASQFQGQTVAQNFAINTLAGGANLTVSGSTTANAIGLVSLGNASGYTGAITVGANAAIGFGDSGAPASSFFGSTTNPITISAVTGGVGLLADGNGTSTPETVTFYLPSNAINFGTGNTTGYIIGKQGANTLLNQAANKTILIAGALPFSNPATNTLNIQPINGYGLLLTLQNALAATTTFGVGTVVSVGGVTTAGQASNVVPGLTLQNLTGSFGINKTGAGTLLLSSGNTFGAAGAAIDIQAGAVATATDAGLGDSNNKVQIDNGGTLLVEGSFTAAHTIAINGTTANIGVSGGNTFTVPTLNYVAAGNGFTKTDNGTLIVTGATTGAASPTGATTISAGALQVSNSNQLGSGTITVAGNVGAALQLVGGPTITQAISLSGSPGLQSRGGVENISGATTLSGAITSGGAYSVFGNDDAANVFTIAGNISMGTTGSLAFLGASGSTIKSTGVISGNGVTIATSPNNTPFNLVLTGVNTTTGQFISAGNATITVSGAGTDAATSNVYTRYGGTIVADNTTNAVSNRFGSGAGTLQTIGGGTFTILGNAGSTVGETFKSFTPAAGADEFTVNATPVAGPANSPVNLVLTATGGTITHVAGESVVFNGTNVISGVGGAGASSSSFNVGAGAVAANFLGGGQVSNLTTTGFANQAILPYALLNNSGTISLATSTVIGANGYLRNLGAGETTSAFTNYLNANPASTANTLATTAATTTLTTNNNIAASLFVGEAVSGTNIPANDFITAISGTTVTLNVAGTAAGTNIPITFGSTGTNLNLTAATSGPGGIVGQAGTLAQTINSLTLNTGGFLTLPNSNTILTVGGNALGGAILSVDPAATISGGQISGGGSELIFHTPSNLSVSSNIIGTGNLTKGEAGTLTLTGASFGTGQINLSGGTLNLNAGNNTLAYPVAVDLGQGTTLALNGNSQLVSSINSDNTNGISNLGITAGGSSITGSGTLAIKQDNTARVYTGVISGTQGLVLSGQNTLILSQAQTYTGPTLVNMAGGTLILQNNGALYGSGTTASSSLTINRAGLTLDNTGTMDSNSRLPNTLAISLGGGTITYNGRAQLASAETLGAVTTTEGSNTFSVASGNVGVSSATLTLTSLSRTTGSTVNFLGSNTTLGAIGSNPQIMLTQVANGTGATLAAPALVNNLLGGGFTVGTGATDWASYNPTYGVGALSTTGFAGYSPLLLNNGGATDNISQATGTGVNLMNGVQNGSSQTVNSLRISGTSAVGFGANGAATSTNTLTLASGGLLTTGALTLGASTNNGVLTSGGSELFLTGTATSIINSAITGSGVALVKSGSGSYTLNGTNAYTGGTYVNQGTLTLGNGGNATIGQSTLGSGGIFLNGGNLTQTAGALLPAQAATITGSSTLTTVSDLVTAATSVTTLGSNTVTVPNGALGVNGIHVGDLVSGTGIPGNEFVTAVNASTNQVTISSGSGVLAGTATALTFRNLSNTLTSLTFNNDGGSSPILTNTGLLNLTSGTITASSSNVGGASTASISSLTGGNVDFNNVASPSIVVNPITFNGQNIAPLQSTLAIASAIQNSSNAIAVSGGGNLTLSGASTFTGGVTLANGTNLTITTASTNAASGKPITGPLGTGVLTIGTGSTLYADTTGRSVGNSVVVTGNFAFDATTSAAAALTLGAGSQTIALPASAATTINVISPVMTAVLNDSVTGAGSSITKTGLGTLQLNNGLGSSSTFSGGVTLNAGTLNVTGVGASGSALGTGSVLVNGGLLSLHHSGIANNGQISFGNNVLINSTLANAFIDVNNNGADTGNTIIMGNLDYGTGSLGAFTSTVVGGNPAPTTILNVTGGNGYKLQFTGTTLTNANTSATFNIASGLSLVLPGGFNTASNLPINIGPGTIIYSGSNTGTAPVSLTGTTGVSIGAAQTNTPLGTGGISLANNSTLQLTPYYTPNVSTTGYTTGGLSAKVYSTGQASGALAANYGIAPGATLLGVQANDSLMRQAPAQITPNGTLNTLIAYQGLLTVTTAGVYNFGGSSDDFANLVIDGQLVQNQGVIQAYGFAPISLAAGTHTITLREFNGVGGGTASLYYNGPDTASNNVTGLTAGANNYQALPLTATSYASGFTAANTYQNAAILNNAITVAAAATATIDGLGTDFNYAVPSLTLSGGSTLNVANGTGTTVGSIGNGAFVVTGLTTLSGAINTISPTTGTLVLAGGVTDGGAGLNKTGVGNLMLNSGGTFTGPLTISNGTVQLLSPGALSTGTNLVTGTATAIATTATLSQNSAAVTVTGSTAGLANGMLVFGPNIPAGATITGLSGSTFNLSTGIANTAGTGQTAPIYFFNTAAASGGDIDLNGQTAVTGNITINGAGPAARSSSAPGALYNSSASPASLGGTLAIGSANTAIGGFGDIALNGAVTDSGNAWVKTGINTLILGSASNVISGNFTVMGGILQLGNASSFGANTGTATIGVGASLDLNGLTVLAANSKPLALYGSGTGYAIANGAYGYGAPSTLGSLINSSATNASYAGAFSLGQATSIGGPSLQSGVNGGITLSGAETGAFAITKVGGNNLTLTSGTSAISQIDVQGGSVTLSGSAKEVFTAAPIIRQGATVTLDSSGTAVSNRWITNSGTYLTGNLIVTGNATTAISEIATAGSGNINIGQANGIGGAVITLNSTGTAGVTFGTQSTSTSIFNRGVASTALLRGDNLGTLVAGTANASNIIGNGTTLGLGNANGQSVGQAGVWNAPNALIYQWVVADTSATGLGTGFAGYNGYNGAVGTGGIGGTTGALQSNIFGVSSLANNANNALAAAPGLTTLNINTTNASATVTTASTTGLVVGQYIVGTGIAGVITAITNGITFIVSANASATANTTAEIYANAGNSTTTFTAQTPAASTTITVPSTANLYAGEVVAGVTAAGVNSGAITNGTTIASITNGTTIVLSNAAAAVAGNLVFGLNGYANISSAAATNTFGITGAAQLVNSLTLNAPGTGSTTTINTGLQLDSGGLLALGNGSPTAYTINSGGSYQYLTGSNTLNREMIFHTVGTGTTLTVNAPIFSNGSGLTKADTGVLVLGTPEVYTGDTTINGGTLKLAGGNNTIFRPFTTAPTAGNAAAGDTGQNLTVDFGATLDLNGTNQAVGNLRNGSATQLSGGTIINSSSSAATLNVALNANQTWAGNISNGQTIGTVTGNTIGLTGSASGGVLNLVRDGNNTLTVNSPNTFGGTLTILGGATRLIDLGTFQNATAITVTRSALIWDDSGTQAVSNRLSSSAGITLNGGGLQFVSRAGTGSNPVDAISLGALSIGVGASSVDPTTVSQGGVSQITFASLNAPALGGTLAFNAGNGTGFVIGDNPKIMFTSAPTVTNGLIGPWATTSGVAGTTNGDQVGFATYDPATGVRMLQYGPANSFGTGINTFVNANFTLPAPINTATTTVTNSLTFAGNTLSFTNYNDTVQVASGGILVGTGNEAIGTTTVPGQLQSGAGKDLYVNTLANTTTINSKIIDNGSNNNVIFNQLGAGSNTATVVLTNANTYGGTTYTSGVQLNLNSLVGPAIPHDLVLSGTNNLGADSLVDSQSQVNWQLPNQLATTSSITMNGATRLNLGNTAGLPGQNVPNTQTINNLTFNNDGGSNSADGPTIFTGAGALAISGAINSTTLAETFTVPTINGFIALTNATPAINVDANQYNPANVGLDINANITAASITKTGLGYLGIGGQNVNLVGTTFNLNAGGLAYSPSAGVGYGDILGSAVVMAGNTTIDTRGGGNATTTSLTLGSVASASSSAVIMNGVQNSSGLLTTGLDNSNTTYAGSFSSPYPTGQLNVTKIGSGQWELQGGAAPTVNGTLTVSAGAVKLDSTGILNFQTYTANTGGTLTLDNTATPTNNRLGGAFYINSGTLAPTLRTIGMQGGNLNINGNSGAAITENLGLVNITGGGVFTLNSAATGGVNVTLQALGGQGAQTSLLLRGDGLGNTAGANTATVQFVTAGAVGTPPGALTLGGGTANNTLTRSVRPDVLVDSSATGLGQGFMVVDSATGLVRPLGFGTGITFASELTGTLLTSTASNTNVSLSTVSFGSSTGNTLAAGNFAASYVNSVGSLTLQNGGGINLAIVPTNPFGANGGLLTVTNNTTGAVLNLAGSNNITAGQYAYNNLTSDFHVLTGSTLTMNAILTGAGGSLVKADGGTLILNAPISGNNGVNIAVNGGTLQLGTGSGTLPSTLGGTSYNTNPLYVWINSGAVPSAENLSVNNGTFDLNGNNQLVGTVTSQNPLPFGGGTSASPNIVITNTSATAATFSTNAAASVFSGEFQGNLNLDKSGNNTMTLSSPQTYAGTTTIRGGNITLRDSAVLASPTINTNFAELILDNTGLSINNSRISSTAAVNLTGGGLKVNQTSAVSSENFGTVTLNGGSNLFYAAQFSNNSNGSSGTFNINNLAVTNNATFLYESPSGGGFNAAQDHVYLTNLNGVPFSAASLVNGILGAQYLTANTGNNFNWATYSNLGGITNPNTNIGGVTTANYGSLGQGAAVNANNVAATTVSIPGQTLNTLAVINPAAAVYMGLNGPSDQLVLAAGGLLINDAGAKGTTTLTGGSLTAGSLNNPSSLYIHSYVGNGLLLQSPIVNNGTGALTLVRDGNAAVNIQPEQTQSAAVPNAGTSLTVPNASGLQIGMGVSGTNVTANTFITNIVGNVLTLSTATGGTAGTNQVLFAPATTGTNNAATTAGSTTVTVAQASLPANFTPVAGQVIGSSVNIPGGTTIVGTPSLSGGIYTITLSQAATTTSAAANLTFGATSNTYTGGTIISSTVDTYAGGTTTLSGFAGATVIPGNLTINGGATVTMATNQGQIASTSAITINGSGVLTLVGTNRFGPTLTFNNSGGNAVPTLNVGTLLDLGNAAALSATNDNTAFTPLVTGGTVNFSNAAGTTINVSGLSVNDLSIASQITTNTFNTTTPIAGAVITKTGSGSLVLPNAQAASLSWALNGGWLFVGNATSLGVNASAGALSFSGNVGLASSNGASGNTIALPTTFTGATNLSLGNGYINSTITLSGAMNLNGQAPTITVPTANLSDTITGAISGSGGFTKAGPGLLTLTPGTASTFTGPVALTGGLITLGNANGLNMSTATPGTNLGADVSIGTTSEININAFPQSFGSLAGGGILANSGASAGLTIGTGSNATNANFSGSLVAATPVNLSLVKTGTNNQTLSGQSYYTGSTTVSGGTLTLKNGSNSATTPTLADTAITVGIGANLAVSAAGATGTSNTVTIGNNTTTAAGASLSLSGSAGAVASFSMADGLIGTFNVVSGATFAGPSLTIGSAGANGPTLTFDIGAATGVNDLLAATKAATVGASGGKIAINALGSNLTTGNTYTLITASGGLGVAGLTLANPVINAGGHTYNANLTASTATSEILTIGTLTSTLANAYWGAGAGASANTVFWNTYNAGATNFSTTQPTFTEAGVLPAFGTNVNFSVAGTTKFATQLGEDFSIESLTFLASNTSATSVSGNNLTINAAGVNGNTAGNGLNVQSGAGATTISSNVVLGGSQTWTNNSAAATGLTVNGATITGSGNNLAIAGSGTTSISSAIQTGAGSFTQNGPGSTTLSGTSTFTGGTTISAGTLIAGAAAPSGAAGAFGNATSAVVLGDANTTTNNSSPSLLTAGFAVGRPVSIANQGTTGAYSIGGSTNGNGSFNGAITAAQSFNVTQVATTSTNALAITGGISSTATTGTQTVSFNGPGAINVTTGSIVDGGTGGHIGVSVTGGTTTLASTGNSYTGPTNVTGGTLNISGSITGATQVTLNGGNVTVSSTGGLATTYGGVGSAVNITAGTLLLTANNAVTGTPTVAMGGGILKVGDTLSSSNQTFGALTLSSTSTIDFGLGSTNQLDFTGLTLAGGAVLNIFNWNAGSYTGANPDNGTFGNDRLLFGTDPGSAVDSQINFYSGNTTSSGFLGTGGQINFTGAGSPNEIVPVPEPTSTALLGAAGLFGLIGLRERSRLRRIAAKKAATVA